MRNKPLTILTLSAAFALSACATTAGAPLPGGSDVALGQKAYVDGPLVQPVEVVEDSRCPMNARCVWAGRLIVQTRIDGAGWRDTANITLGETYGTHDRVIALVSGLPEKTADRETQPAEYRFVYERR